MISTRYKQNTDVQLSTLHETSQEIKISRQALLLKKTIISRHLYQKKSKALHSVATNGPRYQSRPWRVDTTGRQRKKPISITNRMLSPSEMKNTRRPYITPPRIIYRDIIIPSGRKWGSRREIQQIYDPNIITVPFSPSVDRDVIYQALYTFCALARLIYSANLALLLRNSRIRLLYTLDETFNHEQCRVSPARKGKIRSRVARDPRLRDRSQGTMSLQHFLLATGFLHAIHVV